MACSSRHSSSSRMGLTVDTGEGPCPPTCVLVHVSCLNSSSSRSSTGPAPPLMADQLLLLKLLQLQLQPLGSSSTLRTLRQVI